MHIPIQTMQQNSVSDGMDAVEVCGNGMVRHKGGNQGQGVGYHCSVGE